MLTFYYAKNSAAYAPHILLEDIGIDYQAIQIDFKISEQRSQAYLEINPKGRVPALITQRGVLTETPAILTYLAQIVPKLNLAPTDPFDFALAQAFNSYMASTIHVAHAHKLRGTRWANDEAAHESMRAKVTENMYECAEMIEKYYFKGPYVLGDEFSFCDPYLALITRWLRDDEVDLEQFSTIKAHDALMRQRPSMQHVLQLYSS
ncbi:glutathione S-transferase family protein [Candidatus Puniceispirillum sp.]|nr:glutathione S-transferase family protein [Candidatus Puniceispirillum sp.]